MKKFWKQLFVDKPRKQVAPSINKYTIVLSYETLLSKGHRYAEQTKQASTTMRVVRFHNATVKHSVPLRLCSRNPLFFNRINIDTNNTRYGRELHYTAKR